MDYIVLGSILTTFALFALFMGLTLVLRTRSFEIAGRLGQLPAPPVRVQPGSGAASKKRRSPLANLLAAGSGSDLASSLAQADLKMTPGEFVGLNLLAMILGFALGYLLWQQSVIAGLVGLVVGYLAPRWYLGNLQQKRLRAFNGQLGDTIVLLANSLRSGYSLLQSMETVTREMAPPIAPEFARVIREVGLGLSINDALQNMLRRVPSDDLDFLITAININHEVGGNLADILDVIAFTIRERVRIMGEIRTITAQQRLSALILSFLPVGLFGLLSMMNRSYMETLWQSTCGMALLGTGGVLIVIGYFIIRRIATIEV